MAVYGVIQKWGNSQGIRIPKAILLAACLQENDEIEFEMGADGIIVKKRKRPNSLDELFANYNGDYKPVELDEGPAVGREVFD